MITVNSVFKYIDVENEERIRVINIEANEVCIVNIDTATSMLQKENLDKMNEEIEIQKLIEIIDSFIIIIDDKELSEAEIIKRNADWDFIYKYLKESKNEILGKTKRNLVFNRISKESGKPLIKIKRLFSRYWQRGMHKNALLPDYINSGARGKERKLTDNKVVRPKKADYQGEIA